jgi:PBP1b-binding outer membrane lipoprotein LpoB
MTKQAKFIFIIICTSLFISSCGNKKELHYPQVKTTVASTPSNTLKPHDK